MPLVSGARLPVPNPRSDSADSALVSASVNELRPQFASAARDFAKACGCDVGTGRLIPALSLIVAAGDTTTAVALCFEQANRRHRLEVGVRDAAEQAKLHRTLVDKALMKLSAAGVRKFDIKTNGEAESSDFWLAVSWIDQTLSPGEDAEPAPEAAAEPPADPVAAPAPEATEAVAEADEPVLDATEPLAATAEEASNVAESDVVASEVVKPTPVAVK